MPPSASSRRSFRRSRIARLLTFVVAPALLLAGLPSPVAADSVTQTIEDFFPPLTGAVGSVVTLSAWATSGLPVTFGSADASICTVDGTTLTFVAVGTCTVTAAQAGDDTFAPVQASADMIVARPFHMTAVVAHDGIDRVDGAIQVGDRLTLRVEADVPITSCTFSIQTAGGWLMSGSGAPDIDGSCGLWTILPAPLDTVERVPEQGRTNLDVCVMASGLMLADGTTTDETLNDPPTRVMANADRTQPGGVRCFGASRDPRADNVMDFAFDGSGTPVAFDGSPHLLSWNPNDWQADYTPLQFGQPWTVKLPAWIQACGGIYLNGSWVTGLRSPSPSSCQDGWTMTLPGILPSTMPWDASGTWQMQIPISYTRTDGGTGITIFMEDPDIAGSSAAFASTLPGVFPKDLGAARFVTIGDSWTPSFHVSGANGSPEPAGTTCDLGIFVNGSSADWGPNDGLLHHEITAPDENGDCSYSILAPYTSTDQQNQWEITVTFPSLGGAQFYANLYPLDPPAPPIVGDPNGSGDGSGTDITVGTDPGSDSALGIETQVDPGSAPAPLTATVGQARVATAVAASCSSVALSPQLAAGFGGGLSPTTLACPDLADGTYTATALKVDPTGKTVTSWVTFAVTGGVVGILSRDSSGPPAAAIRAPAATNATTVSFGVTFNKDVTGLTAADFSTQGTASGCKVGAPAGSGSGYTVPVTGCSVGTLRLTLAANAVTDGIAPGPAKVVPSTIVRIDRTAPTASVPSVAFRTGGGLAGSAMPGSVAWSGADTGGAGVSRYQAERSADGGATWSAPVTVASPWAVALRPSGTVRFRVRAIDRAGNVGHWMTGPVLDPRIVQDSTAAPAYAGHWPTATSSSYSGGTARYATASGASVSYRFTGRSIALLTTKAPTRGKVRVYVDGTYVATVDLYGATAQYRVVAWQRTWSTTVTRTIRLVVLGTAGRPRVDFDAFAVLR